MRHRVSRHFGSLALCISVLLPSLAAAALPTSVASGEPLPSLAPMLERTTPGVVNIATFATVKQYTNPLFSDPFFRRFFRLPEQQQQAPEKRSQSAGSGVIVDAVKGYVITNHHVIDGAEEVVVTLTDGRALTAEVVGSDQQVDIALLQIEAKNLKALPIADSNAVRVGDFVVAVGNPFGLGQTVTSGIVSAVGRSGLGIQGYEDFIQTDASINPGNSGGALVNLRGELVAINSAILSPAGGNIGIGFAIPTEIMSAVMEQLIRYGEVRRGQLGVQFQDLTPALAEAFGLTRGQGAVIAKVKKGSLADRAGFKAGDVVTRFNQHEVRSASDLHNRIGLTPPGQAFQADVLRQGKSLQLSAVMETTQAETLDGQQIHVDFSGIMLEDVIDTKSGLGVGVRVKQADKNSKAYLAGLRVNDRVAAVNRRRVRSVQELIQVVTGQPELAIRIERGDQAFYLVIR